MPRARSAIRTVVDDNPLIFILMAHVKYTAGGGKGGTFEQWVKDGQHHVLIHVEMRPVGNSWEVLTAYPIPEVHP